jgi:uncharacterized protein YoxC
MSSRILPESLKEPYLQVKRVSKGIAESVESMATKLSNVPRRKKNSSATIVNLKVTPKIFAGERRKIKKREDTWKY